MLPRPFYVRVPRDSASQPLASISLELLGDELKARGLKYTPHYAGAFMQERRRELLDPTAGVYRYDQLIVLKNFICRRSYRAGSIVNRDEELVLSTPAHRSIIAAAVTQAVGKSLRRAGLHNLIPTSRGVCRPRKDRRWSLTRERQPPAGQELAGLA